MTSGMKAAAACAAAAILVGEVAQAGGFSLRERSAHAQGASFAGSTAAASDVTYALFNPAALSMVDHAEMGGGLSLILPDITAEAEINGDRDKPGVAGIVPSTAFGYRLNETYVVGLGVYSPFGLTTEYDEDFVGAADGIRSELISIAVAPMLAIKIADDFHIGGSVAVIYNDPQLTSAGGVNPNTGEVLEVKLNATEVEFGASFGFLFDVTEDTRIGVAYHSGYDITTGGTLSAFDAMANPIDLRGDASISLPMSISFGFRHQMTEDFAVMGEFEWANWSEFDEIRVDVPALGAGRNIGEVTNYKDSYFLALGGEYTWSEDVTVRAGLAYDDTPTQRNGRSIRIPDSDRIWASAGLSYRPMDGFELNLAYSAIFFLDPDVTLINGPPAGTSVDYDGMTHIFSLGATYRF